MRRNTSYLCVAEPGREAGGSAIPSAVSWRRKAIQTSERPYTGWEGVAGRSAYLLQGLGWLWSLTVQDTQLVRLLVSHPQRLYEEAPNFQSRDAPRGMRQRDDQRPDVLSTGPWWVGVSRGLLDIAGTC